jgi:hypothetical protein
MTLEPVFQDLDADWRAGFEMAVDADGSVRVTRLWVEPRQLSPSTNLTATTLKQISLTKARGVAALATTEEREPPAAATRGRPRRYTRYRKIFARYRQLLREGRRDYALVLAREFADGKRVTETDRTNMRSDLRRARKLFEKPITIAVPAGHLGFNSDAPTIQLEPLPAATIQLTPMPPMKNTRKRHSARRSAHR